jgi:hypothetical protein
MQAFKYENLDKVISDLEITVLREAEEKALFLPVPAGFVASLTGKDQESSKLHEPKAFVAITEAIKMGKDGDISKLAPKTPESKAEIEKPPAEKKVLPARDAKSRMSCDLILVLNRDQRESFLLPKKKVAATKNQKLLLPSHPNEFIC